MWRTTILCLALSTILTTGCINPRSSAGFRLPDGDVERGKAAFLELKCYTCHTVSGLDIGARGKERRREARQAAKTAPPADGTASTKDTPAAPADNAPTGDA